MAKNETGRVIPSRLRASPNKVVCTSELGDFQLAVLSAVRALTPRATLNGVIDYLYMKTDEVADVAQTFGALRRLAEDDWKFVERKGKETMEKGGRASTVFGITRSGKDAVAAKVAHMKALVGLAEQAEASNKMVVVKGHQQPETTI